MLQPLSGLLRGKHNFGDRDCTLADNHADRALRSTRMVCTVLPGAFRYRGGRFFQHKCCMWCRGSRFVTGVNALTRGQYPVLPGWYWDGSLRDGCRRGSKRSGQCCKRRNGKFWKFCRWFFRVVPHPSNKQVHWGLAFEIETSEGS